MPHGAALILLLLAAPPDATRKAPPRDLRAFQPGSGQAALESPRQVVQLLLDRQVKADYESYLVQVLFRGKADPEHVIRSFPDRVEIDFLDTGRPAMRLARIRGGALQSSLLEELHYRDPSAATGRAAPIRRMVRLTLFMPGRPELKVRNTLDRSLLHFRMPRSAKKDRSGTAPIDTGFR